MIDASALPKKVCAICGGRFPSEALFCPADGSPLQSSGSVDREVDPYLGQEISGHIEIRQLVGVGAMGRVYRAFQRGIDRDVAVKILHRELSANPQLVSRFTREAKVASRLQHPNVVQVFLAGQLPDRALYMVMEYLDGLSLQSALAAVGGAMPLPRALHIALQLCEAAGEAHAQGIVHRDLKPENVMLVRRGSDPDFVKVLDFGIARINWGEQSVATAAGLIFGTARYISPEGAQGNQVGPASDVYAIGTLLFQMLSGRTPFDGDQAVGLLVQQIHDPAPSLRSIPRAAYVPSPIADVVMATLVKDPAKREPDARALGQCIFDAAKLAGLSPDEFSRPMRRSQSAIQMPSVDATVSAEPAPPKTNGANGSHPGDVAQRPPTAATVKWEPPTEFQARLSELATPVPEPGPSRRELTLEKTIDDLTLDAQQRAALSPSPAFPVATPDVPRTVPGDPDGPIRTRYSPPAPEASPSVPQVIGRSRLPSLPPERPSTRPGTTFEEARRSRGFLLVAMCFVLGVVIAGGWAWKSGKISLGGSAEEDRIVARATDAMFKNRFHEPPGDNVKDITDEGLRRYPNDRRLLDIRIRAANELTTQAISQRSAGDVLEALRLAKVAHDLDPHDASVKRLVEQYEAELASFSPSAAPTLVRPPERPVPNGKPSVAPGPGPGPTAPLPSHIDYKALVDVSTPTPKLGQTVDLTARIAPAKGEFDQPGFTIAGPGIPGGVRMPAQAVAPGVFKGSYAFLEAGRFEVVFSTSADGKPISAKRPVVAGGAPTPPPPSPDPGPTPTGSVKWM